MGSEGLATQVRDCHGTRWHGSPHGAPPHATARPDTRPGCSGRPSAYRIATIASPRQQLTRTGVACLCFCGASVVPVPLRQAIAIKLPRHLAYKGDFRQTLLLDPAAADLRAKDPRFYLRAAKLSRLCVARASASNHDPFYATAALAPHCDGGVSDMCPVCRALLLRCADASPRSIAALHSSPGFRTPSATHCVRTSKTSTPTASATSWTSLRRVRTRSTPPRWRRWT